MQAYVGSRRYLFAVASSEALDALIEVAEHLDVPWDAARDAARALDQTATRQYSVVVVERCLEDAAPLELRTRETIDPMTLRGHRVPSSIAERLRERQPTARFVRLDAQQRKEQEATPSPVIWYAQVRPPWSPGQVRPVLESALVPTVVSTRPPPPTDDLRLLALTHRHGADDLRSLLSSPELGPLSVEQCEHHEEAATRLRHTPFDVVVIDLAGLERRLEETVQNLKHAAEHIAIVALGDEASELATVKALQAGVHEYVVNPRISSRGLQRAVRCALERQRIERKLHQIAQHDALTGLANRARLRARLTESVRHALATESPFGLLFVDMDRFKLVNDSYGHEVGDTLLKTVARRLEESVGSGGVVARLGGDEFAVLTEPGTDRSNVELLARALRENLKTPLHTEGRTIPMSASVGIAMCPADGATAEQILRRADESMYKEKAASESSRVAVTGSVPTASGTVRVGLRIHWRIRRNHRGDAWGFTSSLDASIDGSADGHSANPWTDMELEGGRPDTEWAILDRSLEWFATQLKGGNYPTAKLGVRTTGRLLAGEGAAAELLRHIDGAGIVPEQVQIEIAASTWRRLAEERSDVLTCLTEMGVKLALCDFDGDGIALAQLATEHFGALVLAPGLLREAGHTIRKRQLLHAVLDAGRALELELVAPLHRIALASITGRSEPNVWLEQNMRELTPARVRPAAPAA